MANSVKEGEEIRKSFPGQDFILTTQQVQLLYAEHFLVENFIAKSPYREHLEMNFTEKIFFHEPVNKFFDLVFIKSLAFNSLKHVQHLVDPLSKSKKQNENLQAKCAEQVLYLYKSDERRLKMNSNKIEILVKDLMRLTGAHHWQTQDSDKFIATIKDDEWIDDIVKQLIN